MALGERPVGFVARWRYEYDSEYESATVYEDTEETRRTNGMVKTVICDIAQGDATNALAAYICRLHNEAMQREVEGDL